MGIVKSPQHLPQVPAQAIVQRIGCYASRLQQLVEIIMSAKENVLRVTILRQQTTCTGQVNHSGYGLEDNKGRHPRKAAL